MQNAKIRSIIGFIGFITLILAIAIAIWKYTGVSKSFNDVVSSLKTKNLIQKDNREEISIGYDGYLGYSILNSKYFKRLTRERGLSAILTDDGANYPDRFSKLLNGDLDMAVMPIHDYIEQLYLSQVKSEQAPLIIAAISESKGSDAVVANPDIFPNINAFKDTKQIKAAYTSPFMLNSMAIDANIPILFQKSNIEANEDIEDTYKGLLSGRYDVVGLWEPYITKAKEKGFKVLMGSDELKLGKIIDVVVMNRTFLANHKEELKLFMSTYYESVTYFKNNNNVLIDDIEIKEAGELSRADISASLKSIKFYELGDNVHNLFRTNSMSNEKMLDYIDAVSMKLKKMQLIDKNPIQNSDGRNAIYDKILRDIYNDFASGSIPKPSKEDKVYEPLSKKTWMQLIKDPKFTRDDLKITFLRDGYLNKDAKNILDDFAQNSIKNFDYYIAIVGKSGKAKGLNEEDLIKRTKQKAQKVHDYLSKYWAIDKNRLYPIGIGSKGIKPPKDDENYYQYLNKNNKVELLFIDY